MQEQNEQKRNLQRYVSLAPVLAVIAVSVAFTIWAVLNYFFPDLLFHPLP